MINQVELMQTSLGPLSYRKIGQGARKILFFHGFPGSSAQIQLFESSLEQHQTQVICFDRPGYNLSDIQTENMLEDTIQISEEILKNLNIKKVEIVTVSGGTPYGIYFALKRPELVSSIRVMCGLGYLQNNEIRKLFSNLSLMSIKLLPFIPGRVLQKIVRPGKKKSVEKPSALFEFFYPTSISDRKIIVERNLRSNLDRVLTEAVHLNARGPHYDTKVFLSNWGHNIKNLQVPIHFWHGSEDQVIQAKVSEVMSKLIPHSKLTIMPNEGHLSLPVRHTPQILSLLF